MRIPPRNIDDEYEKCREPYWPMLCGHGGYQFSFSALQSERTFDHTDLIDVYCFEKGGQQEFCLRFDKEEDDYLSAVGIEDLISSASEEPYRTALALLMEDGCISFTPRCTEGES